MIRVMFVDTIIRLLLVIALHLCFGCLHAKPRIQALPPCADCTRPIEAPSIGGGTRP